MPDIDGGSIWKGPFWYSAGQCAWKERAVYSSVPPIFTFHCFVAIKISWAPNDAALLLILLSSAWTFNTFYWDVIWNPPCNPTAPYLISFASFPDACPKTLSRKQICGTQLWCRILKHLIGMKFGRGGSRGGRLCLGRPLSPYTPHYPHLHAF